MNNFNDTLVIGKNSYLANAYLQKYLQKKSFVIATSTKSENSQYKYDLSNPDFFVLDKIINHQLKYAIIFGGVTQISFCESEKEYSYKCNVEGVIKTVEYFIKNDIVPIIFSSDYVFDGKDNNYSETSALNPLNEYGRQKAQIEKIITQKFINNCIIIRLSKVFDIYHKNKFFLETILNLFNIKKMRLAFDQVFSPIYIEDLVDIIFLLQKNNFTGLINVGGKENINRYDFAQKIIEKYKIKSTFVERISINDLDNINRPKNISLDSQKLLSVLNYKFKSIDFYVEQAVLNL